MVKESLTDSFDLAEDRRVVADNANVAPSGEQFAVNWHGMATRLLTIRPETAVGICNAVGQASCLLSSTEVPKDSLREQFRMSVDSVNAVAAVDADNLNRPVGSTNLGFQRTFG